jgi:hypothetical protein
VRRRHSQASRGRRRTMRGCLGAVDDLRQAGPDEARELAVGVEE